MAASTAGKKGPELSKAEYLKRYLSGDDGVKKTKDKLKKKRRKVPGKGWVFCRFLIEVSSAMLFMLAIKLAEMLAVSEK